MEIYWKPKGRDIVVLFEVNNKRFKFIFFVINLSL